MDKRTTTAVIEREGDWYVARSPELDIASQGRSVEEAWQSLAEAVTLFLEEASPEEIARRSSRDGSVEDPVG